MLNFIPCLLVNLILNIIDIPKYSFLILAYRIVPIRSARREETSEGASIIPCHLCVIGDVYSVLLTHDNLSKSTPVKHEVVVAVIVILSNICCAWTMYLCMDSVKFLLETPGPCITNVFATRRKNFSQWHRSFQRKLLSHLLKFLRHVAITLVIQGPGASIVWGCYYFVYNLQTHLGALLLGRALLTWTLRYLNKITHGNTRANSYVRWYNCMTICIHRKLPGSGVFTYIDKHFFKLCGINIKHPCPQLRVNTP